MSLDHTATSVATEAQIALLVEGVGDVLLDDLVGAYLHGSRCSEASGRTATSTSSSFRRDK